MGLGGLLRGSGPVGGFSGGFSASKVGCGEGGVNYIEYVESEEGGFAVVGAMEVLRWR